MLTLPRNHSEFNHLFSDLQFPINITYTILPHPIDSSNKRPKAPRDNIRSNPSIENSPSALWRSTSFSCLGGVAKWRNNSPTSIRLSVDDETLKSPHCRTCVVLEKWSFLHIFFSLFFSVVFLKPRGQVQAFLRLLFAFISANHLLKLCEVWCRRACFLAGRFWCWDWRAGPKIPQARMLSPEWSRRASPVGAGGHHREWRFRKYQGTMVSTSRYLAILRSINRENYTQVRKTFSFTAHLRIQINN